MLCPTVDPDPGKQNPRAHGARRDVTDAGLDRPQGKTARRARPQFSRATAYHEAGHAVALCHYGRRVHAVHVRAKGGPPLVERDGTVHDDEEGMVEARMFRIYPWPFALFPERRRARMMRDGFHDIISLLAGPAAEARYSGGNWLAIHTGGGRNDWLSAFRIGEYLRPDAAQPIVSRAGIVAVTFLAVPAVWAHVTRVAEMLATEGYMDGTHSELQGIKPRRAKGVRGTRGKGARRPSGPS
jgi:hypothetical protein